MVLRIATSLMTVELNENEISEPQLYKCVELLSGMKRHHDDPLAQQRQLIGMHQEPVHVPERHGKDPFQFLQFGRTGLLRADQFTHCDGIANQCVRTTQPVDAAKDVESPFRKHHGRGLGHIDLLAQQRGQFPFLICRRVHVGHVADVGSPGIRLAWFRWRLSNRWMALGRNRMAMVTAAPVEVTDTEWLPLGTFVLTREGVNDSQAMLELAVNGQGVLAGTCYNEATQISRSLKGNAGPGKSARGHRVRRRQKR